MSITAEYASPSQQNIRVTVDGDVHFVPNDMNNRHRRDLAAWEAEGGVIAPSEPAPELVQLPAHPTTEDFATLRADLEAALAALTTRVDTIDERGPVPAEAGIAVDRNIQP